MWVHYNLYFKDYERQKFLSEKRWKEVMLHLKAILEAVAPHVNRYFFLFEPDPHLFLALELKKDVTLEDIAKEIGIIWAVGGGGKNLSNVKDYYFTHHTGDDANGEHQVNFYKASSDYAIWKATSKKYKYGYDFQDESKMLHCFWNMQGKNNTQELLEYFNCALHRGAYVIDYLSRIDFKKRTVKHETTRKLIVTQGDK